METTTVWGFVYYVFLTSFALAQARSNKTQILIIEQQSRILGTELDCSAVDECEEAPGHNSGKFCGKNGITYKSLCEYTRAHCKEGHVHFDHRGECTAAESCAGQRETAMRAAKTDKGIFIPSCIPDGFAPVQCHKDTEYCWCATLAGNAIIGTAIPNAVPNCSNFTNKPSQDTSKKFSNWQKGIETSSEFIPEVMGSQHSILTPTLSPTRPPKVETEASLSLGKKKKPKRPRGCEGSRRGTFNRNMLKNMIQEFKRENKKTFDSDISMQSATLKWKFDQLDTRKDGRLRRTEYKGIQKIVRRNFKPRKCATKFPKFCDLNEDKKISLKEWTNCFVSEDSDYLNNVLGEEKTHKKGESKNSTQKKGSGEITKPLPCEYEMRQAMETSENGNQEIYIPKCDEKGLYHPVQCYGSTGKNLWFCFCVNVETGGMIENTSVHNGTPECPVSWPKCPPPLQEKLFLQSLLSFFTTFAKEKLVDFKKYDKKPGLTEEEKILEKVFAFLDKNRNNFIDGKEKKQLRKIIRKKKILIVCGKKIHTVCDRNTDGKISLEEFLSCIFPQKGTSNYNFVQGKRPTEFKIREKKGKNPFIEVITPE